MGIMDEFDDRNQESMKVCLETKIKAQNKFGNKAKIDIKYIKENSKTKMNNFTAIAEVDSKTFGEMMKVE